MNPVSFYSAACVSLSLSLLSGLLVRLLLIEFFASQLAPLAEVSTDGGRVGMWRGGTVLRFCILRVGLSGLLADFKLGFHGN